MQTTQVVGCNAREASADSSQNISAKRFGYEFGATIGGVFCGKEIGNDLFAEKLTDRRYVIRQRIDPSYARRIGEVCGGEQYGGGKCYQATKPNGDHVAIGKTFKAIAKTLIQD